MCDHTCKGKEKSAYEPSGPSGRLGFHTMKQLGVLLLPLLPLDGMLVHRRVTPSSKYGLGGERYYAIGHFQKYHNSLCYPSKILHKHCFAVAREIENNAYAKFLEGQQRVLWYFFKWPIKVPCPRATQQPRPGLKPGPLDPEFSVL